jgi:hypothetical protein
MAYKVKESRKEKRKKKIKRKEQNKRKKKVSKLNGIGHFLKCKQI